MKVFISHSWNDKSLATQICETLKKDGHEVWYDIHQLLPGDTIQAEIDACLAKCDVMVLVWTAFASSSAGVNAEIQTAKGLGKRIIPLQVDTTSINLHPQLNGLLGIPFDDVPTGLLLLQRCLLMLMAADYKETPWFREAFDNVVDLGGYLYYTNTYRLKNNKNEDGAKEQWAARLEELRKKNEDIRRHVMSDAQDKMLMLQNIMQRLEQGNVPLKDLEQWQQWCSANATFHPELMGKLKTFIENDIRRLQEGGAPVSVLNLADAEKTVHRLEAAIEQKKGAAHQDLVQKLKGFAVFILGDRIIQSIVGGYLNYITGSPALLKALITEANTSGSVAVKEAVIRLLNYLDSQDHEAERRKENLEGYFDDAYLINNSAKLLVESALVAKEKLSLDFVAINIVDKYVSFILDAGAKTKLDHILQDIRALIGLKKNEINWGQVAVAALALAAVGAMQTDTSGGGGSRSSTFEDQVGDFNARYGTSFNV
ncbi:MAG TPA: toll/interleukin-1 receptor domain-containing protein [Flavisolibacter sp.]|jgi:hypothetical protein|nr:toll/interleukin-1 receptor domain-containing protein [Flavisolibacter sp.]